MNVCLDTDVLIDCLRGLPAAQAWLAAEATETLFIPGVVAMELLMGARNKSDLEKIRKFVETFPVLWHNPNEFERAYLLLVEYRSTLNLSIPDCFIAATALERSLRLYTFNVRHYQAIPGLDVQIPYQRS
jgi:hypothetical protein